MFLRARTRGPGRNVAAYLPQLLASSAWRRTPTGRWARWPHEIIMPVALGALVSWSRGHGLSGSTGALAISNRGTWGMSMGYSGTTEADRERTRAERLTEGLTVAVASVLAFVLLAGLATVLGTTAWHLVTDTGTSASSRLSTPMILLALVALPVVLACPVFRAGRRKGMNS